jgi:hypothetical protein
MVGFDVIQTADSNFVLTGYKNSSSPKIHLKKIDQNGNTLWTQVVGPIGSWGQAVHETFDGGFIIAGSALQKTDNLGNILWTKSAGGGQLMYVVQNPDSTYVTSGTSASQIFLVKRDTAGNTIWTKTYPGKMYNPSNNNLIRTSSGGYALCASYSSGTAMLLKTNSNGDTLWTKSMPGHDGTSIVETADKGYAMATWDSAGSSAMLVRTDSNGVILYTKYYGGADEDWAQSVALTSDGGFALAGGTKSFGNGYQFFLVKTDSLGNIPSGAGIDETAEYLSGSVYPNPFSSQGTIDFGRAVQNAKLVITDIAGRTVSQSDHISGTSVTIDGMTMKPGIYVFHVSQNNLQVLQGKFIVIE